MVGYFSGLLPEPRGPEAFLFPPPVVRCCTCQRAAPALTLAGLASAFEFWAQNSDAQKTLQIIVKTLRSENLANRSKNAPRAKAAQKTLQIVVKTLRRPGHAANPASAPLLIKNKSAAKDPGGTEAMGKRVFLLGWPRPKIPGSLASFTMHAFSAVAHPRSPESGPASAFGRLFFRTAP